MSKKMNTGPFVMRFQHIGEAWCYLERGGRVSVYDKDRPGTFVGFVPAHVVRRAAKLLPKKRKITKRRTQP